MLATCPVPVGLSASATPSTSQNIIVPTTKSRRASKEVLSHALSFSISTPGPVNRADEITVTAKLTSGNAVSAPASRQSSSSSQQTVDCDAHVNIDSSVPVDLDSKATHASDDASATAAAASKTISTTCTTNIVTTVTSTSSTTSSNAAVSNNTILPPPALALVSSALLASGGAPATSLTGGTHNGNASSGAIVPVGAVNTVASPEATALASAVAAAKLGLIDQLRTALNSHDSLVNLRDAEGRTCLHYAAGYGYDECVDLLLSKNADTKVQDCNGDVPLHFASIHGHAMCAYNMGKAGPGACLIQNTRGQTPVDVAVACERGEVLNAMLLACAGDATEVAVSAMRVLLKDGAVPDTWAPNGSSALMLAASVDGTDALKVLLEAGASIELQDALGRSALMFAAGNCAHSALITLLDAGACMSLRDRRGRCVLDYAPETSQVRITLQGRLKALEAVAQQLQDDLLASLEDPASTSKPAKSVKAGGNASSNVKGGAKNVAAGTSKAVQDTAKTAVVAIKQQPTAAAAASAPASGSGSNKKKTKKAANASNSAPAASTSEIFSLVDNSTMKIDEKPDLPVTASTVPPVVPKKAANGKVKNDKASKQATQASASTLRVMEPTPAETAHVPVTDAEAASRFTTTSPVAAVVASSRVATPAASSPSSRRASMDVPSIGPVQLLQDSKAPADVVTAVAAECTTCVTGGETEAEADGWQMVGQKAGKKGSPAPPAYTASTVSKAATVASVVGASGNAKAAASQAKSQGVASRSGPAHPAAPAKSQQNSVSTSAAAVIVGKAASNGVQLSAVVHTVTTTGLVSVAPVPVCDSMVRQGSGHSLSSLGSCDSHACSNASCSSRLSNASSLLSHSTLSTVVSAGNNTAHAIAGSSFQHQPSRLSGNVPCPASAGCAAPVSQASGTTQAAPGNATPAASVPNAWAARCKTGGNAKSPAASEVSTPAAATPAQVLNQDGCADVAVTAAAAPARTWANTLLTRAAPPPLIVKNGQASASPAVRTPVHTEPNSPTHAQASISKPTLLASKPVQLSRAGQQATGRAEAGVQCDDVYAVSTFEAFVQAVPYTADKCVQAELQAQTVETSVHGNANDVAQLQAQLAMLQAELHAADARTKDLENQLAAEKQRDVDTSLVEQAVYVERLRIVSHLLSVGMTPSALVTLLEPLGGSSSGNTSGDSAGMQSCMGPDLGAMAAPPTPGMGDTDACTAALLQSLLASQGAGVAGCIPGLADTLDLAAVYAGQACLDSARLDQPLLSHDPVQATASSDLPSDSNQQEGGSVPSMTPSVAADPARRLSTGACDTPVGNAPAAPRTAQEVAAAVRAGQLVSPHSLHSSPAVRAASCLGMARVMEKAQDSSGLSGGVQNQDTPKQPRTAAEVAAEIRRQRQQQQQAKLAVAASGSVDGLSSRMSTDSVLNKITQICRTSEPLKSRLSADAPVFCSKASHATSPLGTSPGISNNVWGSSGNLSAQHSLHGRSPLSSPIIADVVCHGNAPVGLDSDSDDMCCLERAPTLALDGIPTTTCAASTATAAAAPAVTSTGSSPVNRPAVACMSKDNSLSSLDEACVLLDAGTDLVSLLAEELNDDDKAGAFTASNAGANNSSALSSKTSSTSNLPAMDHSFAFTRSNACPAADGDAVSNAHICALDTPLIQALSTVCSTDRTGSVASTISAPMNIPGGAESGETVQNWTHTALATSADALHMSSIDSDAETGNAANASGVASGPFSCHAAAHSMPSTYARHMWDQAAVSEAVKIGAGRRCSFDHSGVRGISSPEGAGRPFTSTRESVVSPKDTSSSSAAAVAESVPADSDKDCIGNLSVAIGSQNAAGSLLSPSNSARAGSKRHPMGRPPRPVSTLASHHSATPALPNAAALPAGSHVPLRSVHGFATASSVPLPQPEAESQFPLNPFRSQSHLTEQSGDVFLGTPSVDAVKSDVVLASKPSNVDTGSTTTKAIQIQVERTGSNILSANDAEVEFLPAPRAGVVSPYCGSPLPDTSYVVEAALRPSCSQLAAESSVASSRLFDACPLFVDRSASGREPKRMSMDVVRPGPSPCQTFLGSRASYGMGERADVNSSPTRHLQWFMADTDPLGSIRQQFAQNQQAAASTALNKPRFENAPWLHRGDLDNGPLRRSSFGAEYLLSPSPSAGTDVTPVGWSQDIPRPGSRTSAAGNGHARRRDDGCLGSGLNLPECL